MVHFIVFCVLVFATSAIAKSTLECEQMATCKNRGDEADKKCALDCLEIRKYDGGFCNENLMCQCHIRPKFHNATDMEYENYRDCLGTVPGSEEEKKICLFSCLNNTTYVGGFCDENRVCQCITATFPIANPFPLRTCGINESSTACSNDCNRNPLFSTGNCNEDGICYCFLRD